jgi:hypothetical protein
MMIMITGSHPGPAVSRVAETRRFPAPPDRDLPCAADAHAVASRSRSVDVDAVRSAWPTEPLTGSLRTRTLPAATPRRRTVANIPGFPASAAVSSCTWHGAAGTEAETEPHSASGPGPDSSGESEAGESEPPSHRDGASVCHGATCELEAAGTRGVSDRQPRGPRRGHQLSGLVA